LAKKKDNNQEDIVPAKQTGKVFVTPLEEVLPMSMLPYAEFVILDRALPRVEDGLKPVQRRILYTMYERGSYSPAELESAVEICAELTEMFEDAGIDVIRIGLQTTDSINAATVKGPYHEALGELVYSRIYRHRIEKYIADRGAEGDFIYYVPPGDVSKAVGHKKANTEYFKQKYNIDITIREKQR